jgi:hypothetical protein
VTTHSLNARIARLEQHVPAPQGPIVYRVYFHDGTPVFPRSDEDPAVPVPPSHDEGVGVVYRIAGWEESDFGGAAAGIARYRG